MLATSSIISSTLVIMVSVLGPIQSSNLLSMLITSSIMTSILLIMVSVLGPIQLSNLLSMLIASSIMTSTNDSILQTFCLIIHTVSLIDSRSTPLLQHPPAEHAKTEPPGLQGPGGASSRGAFTISFV